jgi:hypothetical protein
MKWIFRRQQPPTVSPSETPANDRPATEPRQRSRRGLLGLFKTTGVAVAAVVGVGALTQRNAPSAYADNLGNFSSSNFAAPAVKAVGTDGAYGIYASSDTANGVYGASQSGYGLFGTSYSNYAVYGNSANSAGVFGYSNSNYGVYGESTDSYGVYGYSSDSYGVYGYGVENCGVYGYCSSNIAVTGFSQEAYGVYGTSNGSIGVIGASGENGTYGVLGLSDNNTGVYSISFSTTQPGFYATGGSQAGVFNGNVQVKGTLSKGGGSFLIDHPLDPANKKLYHSFVESPDMKNIYDGIATLDQKGEAVVTLPDWFGTLNSDFRYQLTGIGSFDPVCIKQKIENNQFIIGGTQGMEVSWQVTGIRQDPWAQQYRIPVEEEKTADERGLYYHPEVYGQSDDKGILHRPEIKRPPQQSVPPRP